MVICYIAQQIPSIISQFNRVTILPFISMYHISILIQHTNLLVVSIPNYKTGRHWTRESFPRSNISWRLYSTSWFTRKRIYMYLFTITNQQITLMYTQTQWGESQSDHSRSLCFSDIVDLLDFNSHQAVIPPIANHELRPFRMILSYIVRIPQVFQLYFLRLIWSYKNRKPKIRKTYKRHLQPRQLTLTETGCLILERHNRHLQHRQLTHRESGYLRVERHDRHLQHRQLTHRESGYLRVERHDRHLQHRQLTHRESGYLRPEDTIVTNN